MPPKRGRAALDYYKYTAADAKLKDTFDEERLEEEEPPSAGLAFTEWPCTPEEDFVAHIRQPPTLPRAQRLGFSVNDDGTGPSYRNAAIVALMNSAYFYQYLEWYETKVGFESKTGSSIGKEPRYTRLLNDIRKAYWHADPDQGDINKAMKEFWDQLVKDVGAADGVMAGRGWFELLYREADVNVPIDQWVTGARDSHHEVGAFITWLLDYLEREMHADCGPDDDHNEMRDPLVSPDASQRQQNYNVVFGQPIVERALCGECKNPVWRRSKSPSEKTQHVLKVNMPNSHLGAGGDRNVSKPVEECIGAALDGFDEAFAEVKEKCPRCKKTMTFDVTKKLVHAPEVLVIDINRIEEGASKLIAILNQTPVPEHLHFDQWLEPTVFGDRGKVRYRLTAVINQQGMPYDPDSKTYARQINREAPPKKKTPWREYSNAATKDKDFEECNDTKTRVKPPQKIIDKELLSRPSVLIYEKQSEFRSEMFQFLNRGKAHTEDVVPEETRGDRQKRPRIAHQEKKDVFLFDTGPFPIERPGQEKADGDEEGNEGGDEQQRESQEKESQEDRNDDEYVEDEDEDEEEEDDEQSDSTYEELPELDPQEEPSSSQRSKRRKPGEKSDGNGGSSKRRKTESIKEVTDALYPDLVIPEGLRRHPDVPPAKKPAWWEMYGGEGPEPAPARAFQGLWPGADPKHTTHQKTVGASRSRTEAKNSHKPEMVKAELHTAIQVGGYTVRYSKVKMKNFNIADPSMHVGVRSVVKAPHPTKKGEFIYLDVVESWRDQWAEANWQVEDAAAGGSAAVGPSVVDEARQVTVVLPPAEKPAEENGGQA